MYPPVPRMQHSILFPPDRPLIVLVGEPTSFMDTYSLIKAAFLEADIKHFYVAVNMAIANLRRRTIFPASAISPIVFSMSSCLCRAYSLFECASQISDRAQTRHIRPEPSRETVAFQKISKGLLTGPVNETNGIRYLDARKVQGPPHEADYTDAQFEPETLISTHMDLVKRIAWHLHGRVHSAIEIDDLLQIGYVGLITAAQKYSKQEGVAFASYASLRIRGAMVDHLRKKFEFVPHNNSDAKRFTASEENLTWLNRTPHHDEIAADMNITIEELTEWQHAFAANVHDSLEGVYDDFSVLFATPGDSRRIAFRQGHAQYP